MHHIVCEPVALFKKSARQGFHRRVRLERRAVQQLERFAIIDSRIAALSTRPEAKGIMINLTPVASTKVKEIMTMQNPSPTALRVAVVGGGCSGFQYHMAFENQTNDTDQIFEFDGLKVAVDQMSSMYLDGIEIDYIETVEGAGFKFNNPNVKSTCGCGSSFSV
jgi:iron-sulfur cluster assembly accessory protein